MADRALILCLLAFASRDAFAYDPPQNLPSYCSPQVMQGNGVTSRLTQVNGSQFQGTLKYQNGVLMEMGGTVAQISRIREIQNSLYSTIHPPSQAPYPSDVTRSPSRPGDLLSLRPGDLIGKRGVTNFTVTFDASGNVRTVSYRRGYDESSPGIDRPVYLSVVPGTQPNDPIYLEIAQHVKQLQADANECRRRQTAQQAQEAQLAADLEKAKLAMQAFLSSPPASSAKPASQTEKASASRQDSPDSHSTRNPFGISFFDWFPRFRSAE